MYESLQRTPSLRRVNRAPVGSLGSIPGSHHFLWVALATALIVTIVSLPTLRYGAPNGQSIYIDMLWSQNFSGQLLAGDPYPRWLMDMNRGAGSPTFYYYAPLPFYLLTVPHVLFPMLTPSKQLAVGDALLIWLSGLSFFYYARSMFDSRIAFVGSIMYMFLPYHFEIDLWRREDLGELCNYIWMPLVFHFAESTLRSGKGVAPLAISYALLVFSHLPTALLISFILAIYLPITGAGSPRHRYLSLLGGFVCGLSLAGVYWIPALSMQQYIHIERLWTPYFDFHRWLFPIDSTLFTNEPGRFLFSRRLILSIAVVTGVFLLCSLSTIAARGREALQLLRDSSLLFALAWFLMSPLSTYVWELTPLWKVQFPWRVAVLCDFAAAISVLHAVHCMSRQVKSLVIIPPLIAAALVTYCFAGSGLYKLLTPYCDPSLLAAVRDFYANGIDVSEYAPRWNSSDPADISAAIAGTDRLEYRKDRASISVGRWRPGDIQLQANVLTPTELVLRQYYFPTWHARAAGAALQPGASVPNGLITLALPVGSYDVNLTLVADARQILGWASTLAGILLIATYGIVRCQGSLSPARFFNATLTYGILGGKRSDPGPAPEGPGADGHSRRELTWWHRRTRSGRFPNDGWPRPN